MKYFTKEELEDITNELITNPSRETLQMLNEKYNGPVVNKVPNLGTEININTTMPNEEISMQMPWMTNTMQNIELPKLEEIPVNNSVPNAEVINFELPKLEPQVVNNPQIINPAAFDANMFAPMSETANVTGMMPELNNQVMPTINTEVPVNTPVTANNNVYIEPTPVVNREMPVTENVQPVMQGPTMFGQLQNDYRNAA